MVGRSQVMAWARYAMTLPERCTRALFAGAGGAVQETGQVVLPRFVRRSRLYEATAKNALRIAVELVGGVSPAETTSAEMMSAGRVAVKKAAGNVVELGSIAAFGFSPLWLLAAAADILNGSRVYLASLEAELIAAGLLPEGARFGSVDQLIGALEGTAGTTATLIDLPPLELAEMRRSLGELKADAASLPTPAEMTALFTGLAETARAENRSLLEVSSGVGLAFLTAAKNVGREQLLIPYRDQWEPLRKEGFGAYSARVGRPYVEAITAHFGRDRDTVTERLPELGRRALAWLAKRFRGGGSERSPEATDRRPDAP